MMVKIILPKNTTSTPLDNVIIKHAGKRIRGKSDIGQICYYVNFRSAYYYVNKLYILKKNSLFNRVVMISPSLAEKPAEERLALFGAFSGMTLCLKVA